jgi:hypothetical protein
MSHNQAFFEPELITARVKAFEATLRTLGLVDHTGLTQKSSPRKSLSSSVWRAAKAKVLPRTL